MPRSAIDGNCIMLGRIFQSLENKFEHWGRGEIGKKGRMEGVKTGKCSCQRGRCGDCLNGISIGISYRAHYPFA